VFLRFEGVDAGRQLQLLWQLLFDVD